MANSLKRNRKRRTKKKFQRTRHFHRANDYVSNFFSSILLTSKLVGSIRMHVRAKLHSCSRIVADQSKPRFQWIACFLAINWDFFFHSPFKCTDHAISPPPPLSPFLIIKSQSVEYYSFRISFRWQELQSFPRNSLKVWIFRIFIQLMFLSPLN